MGGPVKVHPQGYLVKLVRDRVARALGGDGTVTYQPMTHEEHVKRLRHKLVEEALEYAMEPSLEELAQVLEAVRAIANVDLGVGLPEVDAERERQWQERGGFVKGVGMYALHPFDHQETP
jgi:predicted house-cleaning noncanonical NTP pyrophosphatase (MazG superfamily)